MRSIGKLALVLAVAGMLTTPAWAGHLAGYSGGSANWTRLTQAHGPNFINYYQGNGGEFTLYGTGLLLSNAAYATTTKAQDGRSESFQTFCVELSETIIDPMDVWVSTAWKTGANDPDWAPGVDHFPQSHAWEGGNPGVGDDLDPATAYLYYHFATGNLLNYAYGGAGRAASAGALQKAIWSIEGELLGGLGGWDGGFQLDAGQQLQAAAWIAAANWTDIGPVRVLQTTGSAPLKQDQLYLIPAPGAVLLGVIGLGTIVWVRKRLT